MCHCREYPCLLWMTRETECRLLTPPSSVWRGRRGRSWSRRSGGGWRAGWRRRTPGTCSGWSWSRHWARPPQSLFSQSVWAETGPGRRERIVSSCDLCPDCCYSTSLRSSHLRLKWKNRIKRLFFFNLCNDQEEEELTSSRTTLTHHTHSSQIVWVKYVKKFLLVDLSYPSSQPRNSVVRAFARKAEGHVMPCHMSCVVTNQPQKELQAIE